MRNQELVDRFFDGAVSGAASRMSIGTTYDGGVYILGYGHAVYAYRPPDGRFGPVVFDGWKGASKTTTQHISLIERHADHSANGRPGVTDVEQDPDLEVLLSISGDDKNYSTSQRSFRGRSGGM
jgi:hypothetical protein